MPIYADAKTKHVEDRIAEAFAAQYGFKWVRYATSLDTPDHVFRYQDVAIYAETKRRYNRFGHYEDYFIDKQKVLRLTEQFEPKCCILLIGFDDVFAHLYLNKAWCKESTGGRTDRADRYDIDQLVHYRWDDFKVDGKRGKLYP